MDKQEIVREERGEPYPLLAARPADCRYAKIKKQPPNTLLTPNCMLTMTVTLRMKCPNCSE
jgi:hypothetical protein